MPRLHSIVPVVGIEMSGDNMCFRDRLLSFMASIVAYMYCHVFGDAYFYANKYGLPESMGNYHDLIQNASLWLYLEDLSIGFPAPNMPNTVSIGDIMAGQPEEPLPQELEEFLLRSDTTILVSLGSFLDHVPDHFARKFCETFRQMKEIHILWKLKNNKFCTEEPNVKILPWLPQNNLLAHKKVRLFITHGGFNSLMESVSHAKPVIVFPLAFDQPDQAVVAAAKGFGIRMDLADFTIPDFVKNVRKILDDPSFTENVKMASSILKDKKETPAQRASFMIEHVIKYGDKHLRTGAYKLNVFQYIMLDIFVFISFLVIIFTFLSVACATCFYRFLRKVCFVEKKSKYIHTNEMCV